MSKDVINYQVLVSDDSHCQAFNFFHRVPSALQQEMSDRSALVEFMAELANEHHQELVEAHPWRCVICQKPATSLIHHRFSHIHLKDNPFIGDYPSPVCLDGSRCAVIAHTEVNKMVAGHFRNVDNQNMQQKEKRNACEHCNKKTKDELKQCGRCKNVSYCSRECQVAHWPKHKIDCTKNESK